MLRLTLVVVLVACDKGPIQEHRIRYTHAGLGGQDVNLEVDLGNRTAVWRDHRNVVVTQAALSEHDAQQLRDLASCARDEKVDANQTFDDNARLVLEGDQRRQIDHGGRASAPCTAKLELRLAALAH